MSDDYLADELYQKQLAARANGPTQVMPPVESASEVYAGDPDSLYKMQLAARRAQLPKEAEPVKAEAPPSEEMRNEKPADKPRDNKR